MELILYENVGLKGSYVSLSMVFSVWSVTQFGNPDGKAEEVVGEDRASSTKASPLCCCSSLTPASGRRLGCNRNCCGNAAAFARF